MASRGCRVGAGRGEQLRRHRTPDRSRRRAPVRPGRARVQDRRRLPPPDGHRPERPLPHLRSDPRSHRLDLAALRRRRSLHRGRLHPCVWSLLVATQRRSGLRRRRPLHRGRQLRCWRVCARRRQGLLRRRSGPLRARHLRPPRRELRGHRRAGRDPVRRRRRPVHEQPDVRQRPVRQPAKRLLRLRRRLHRRPLQRGHLLARGPQRATLRGDRARLPDGRVL